MPPLLTKPLCDLIPPGADPGAESGSVSSAQADGFSGESSDFAGRSRPAGGGTPVASVDIAAEMSTLEMSTLPAAKAAARRSILAARRALSPAEREVFARRAAERLLADPAWQGASCVALYAAVRDEMPTRFLLESALAAGKTLLLPRCLAPSAGPGLMHFHVCPDLSCLAPGTLGIDEPDPARCPVAAELPDLLILPAVGLDRQGRRLGYGGGYYDRLLAGHGWNAVRRAGLVFALQVVPHLPGDAQDQYVHGWITEEELTWR